MGKENTTQRDNGNSSSGRTHTVTHWSRSFGRGTGGMVPVSHRRNMRNGGWCSKSAPDPNSEWGSCRCLMSWSQIRDLSVLCSLIWAWCLKVLCAQRTLDLHCLGTQSLYTAVVHLGLTTITLPHSPRTRITRAVPGSIRYILRDQCTSE